MSHSIGAYSGALALILGTAVGCASSLPGVNLDRASSTTGRPVLDCGPPLSREEIYNALLRILELPSRESLLATSRVSIETNDCEYAIIIEDHDQVAGEPLYFSIDRAGKVTNPPACMWLGDLGNCSIPREAAPLPLSSLKEGCRIEKSWIGLDSLPWGAWLFCGEGQPVLIVEPLSLLGKVEIGSEEQALEFIRFFSSPPNHELFRLNGLAEFSTDPGYWGQNIVQVLGLGAEFHLPKITTTTSNRLCIDEQAAQRTCTLTTFAIRRVAVFFDGNVYDVLEELTEDGSYELREKQLLVRQISRFGLHHDPPSLPEPFFAPDAPPRSPQ